jgi:hypothetical protein
MAWCEMCLTALAESTLAAPENEIRLVFRASVQKISKENQNITHRFEVRMERALGAVKKSIYPEPALTLLIREL